MARRFTKYPSGYVRASSAPRSQLSNADFRRLQQQIQNGEPITRSEFNQLSELRDDYDKACQAEMRKPVQRCDMGYAMYMRDSALEVKQLLESAIVE